jgi:ankyrin repeat protein
MNEFNSLRHAAGAGDADLVRELIQQGASIGEMDNAPLRWALRHKRADIVALLLAAGAEISANATEFLSLAAKHGDGDSLTLMLNAMKLPILPNALDLAFYDAINARHLEAVEILIAAGANPKADDNKPVQLASSVGSAEILEILQVHGADLCVLESQPLFNAVMAEDVTSVKLLLSAGADANARLGISIVLAISNGDTEIVELLLWAGGKLATPDLVVHCADSDSVETLLVLAEAGYDYHPYADEIVKSAAGDSSFKILKFILENAPVSQLGRNAALCSAASKPSEPVLDLLIQHGADAGADRSAALKTAIEARQFGYARKLLAANAHIPDLKAQAVLRVIEAGDWPLLVTLLQGGISVAELNLSEMQAVDLFHNVTPPKMLRDSVGTALSKTIRDERQKFVRVSAQIAAPSSSEQKTAIAVWLTQFLMELNKTT